MKLLFFAVVQVVKDILDTEQAYLHDLHVSLLLFSLTCTQENTHYIVWVVHIKDVLCVLCVMDHCYLSSSAVLALGVPRSSQVNQHVSVHSPTPLSRVLTTLYTLPQSLSHSP